MMHAYRTHTCGQLRAQDVGSQVRLSGWVHRKRDHGNLLFVDLRDHYGLTQIVTDIESEAFKQLERLGRHDHRRRRCPRGRGGEPQSRDR